MIRSAAPATPRPELKYRFATAGVGLPVLFLLIYIGGWPFAIAAGIVALLASAEFIHGWLFPSLPLASVWNLAPMFAPAAIMVIGAHTAWQFLAVGVGFAAALTLIGFSRSNAFGPRKPYRVFAACFVYIGLLLGTLVLARELDQGRDWIFFTFLATFSVDTGAYAVGRAIGRHKLAPRISPKKTVEGAIGGYLAGSGAVLGLRALLDIDASIAAITVLALALPVAAIIGDLFESWMKRRMGVKDASGLLPGHGGFLDRLDSILFVAPLVYCVARLAAE